MKYVTKKAAQMLSRQGKQATNIKYFLGECLEDISKPSCRKVFFCLLRVKKKTWKNSYFEAQKYGQ